MTAPPSSFPTQQRLNALSAALDGRGISVLHQTRDHVFDFADWLPSPWSCEDVLMRREADFMDATLASRFSDEVEATLSSQTEKSFEFELTSGGRVSAFAVRLLPEADGVTSILTDITEQRSREAALAALLREVSHRSKNLLAIIQSVAMQTAHNSGGIDEFLNKFRGRLHALSSTQDLVTDSDWRGTNLQLLVRSQLSRVGHSTFQSVRITGQNPMLSPNASLHVGLAIHELAVNAVSHGGMSQGDNGQIVIDATIEDADDLQKRLVLQWQETGIDPQKPAAPSRFGTLVLERIVPLSVGGTATYALEDDRVIYRLVIPADQFEA